MKRVTEKGADFIPRRVSGQAVTKVVVMVYSILMLMDEFLITRMKYLRVSHT